MAGPGRAQNTVALPEMREARVAVAIVTLLSRSTGTAASGIDYRSPLQAHAIAHGQLAYYLALEKTGHARLLRDARQLEEHMREWTTWDEQNPTSSGPDAPPLGFALSMEGADPILAPDELEDWWRRGLRFLGLSHYGRNRYAGGTGVEDGLGADAPALLAAMAELGVVLDVTHCSDASFWEALALYDGPVLASHTNARALVPHQRQFTDDQFRAVLERDGVIGVVTSCWQLTAGHRHGDANRDTSLVDAVDHIEHICNLAGDTRHVGIGSDLDGGFGREGSPHDLDTIADLRALAGLPHGRGFGEEDVARIMHGNWLRVLEGALG
jgi:membrane dipeptidase